MFWILLIFILALSSFIAFKYGKIHELHKTRAAFEHYLDAHPLLNDAVFGIQVAERIVNDLIKEEEI